MTHYWPPSGYDDLPYDHEEECPDCDKSETQMNDMISEVLILLEDKSKPAAGKIVLLKRFFDEWAKDRL